MRNGPGYMPILVGCSIEVQRYPFWQKTGQHMCSYIEAYMDRFCNGPGNQLLLHFFLTAVLYNAFLICLLRSFLLTHFLAWIFACEWNPRNGVCPLMFCSGLHSNFLIEFASIDFEIPNHLSKHSDYRFTFYNNVARQINYMKLYCRGKNEFVSLHFLIRPVPA